MFPKDSRLVLFYCRSFWDFGASVIGFKVVLGDFDSGFCVLVPRFEVKVISCHFRELEMASTVNLTRRRK